MSGLDATRAGNAGSGYNGQQANYTATVAFRNAMLDAGIPPPDDIVASGHLTRFKIENKLNGWYVLHIDGRAAGSFGNWKSGQTFKWKLNGNYPKLSNQQQADFLIEAHRQKLIRQAEESAKHTAAAQKAAYIWSRATPAPESHAYLVKKRIQPHGARLGRGNTLVIPLYDSNRKLVNLQFINEDGGKLFLSGGKKKACFNWLGETETTNVLIVEGFATGASLFEESGNLTIVAFDAGNLVSVAQAVRLLMPQAEIIICGDNDESGVGQKSARLAALAIGGKYIIPPTPGDDWNDVLSRAVFYE